MHVSILSTYPPRACGLATFARDLRDGLLTTGAEVDAVASVRELGAPGRLPEVAYELRQDERADYAAAAEALAATDVLSVQHEFGIFGGPEGTHVLDLMGAVEAPVVTTLHTVLPEPSPEIARAMRAVARRSERLVVMTETARELLAAVYDVDRAKVDVIPHGTPDLPRPDRDALKAELGLAGRRVLLTFGLLGPSKGIEFALESLQAAVDADPSVLYVILGATHPEIVRNEGEAYRESLQAEVAARGLSPHVRFEDRYVDTDELWAWLCAADVYVSPYPGMDQICSGTLAFALAAGLPVVSTPYLHAREVLAPDAEGRAAGALVPFGDAPAFGAALARYVSDDAARAEAGAAALAFGARTAWPATGARYRATFERALAERRPPEPLAAHPAALPAALGYLRRLTDGTGPFQHATFGVPDRAHGYCTDDAARALVAALDALPLLDGQAHADATAVAETCLSFVAHALQDSGRFRNFMGFDRRWLDGEAGDDTTGRAAWGLGAAAAAAPTLAARRLARELLLRTDLAGLDEPRALAYAALGLGLALDRRPGDPALRDRLAHLGRRLLEHADRHLADDWPWLSNEMTYGNAVVPHAVARAADHVGGELGERLAALGARLEQTALDVMTPGERFEAVGNRGWFARGDSAPPPFDEQPIEAGYAAWAWADAADRTDDAERAAALRRSARLAVAWFGGRNRLGLALFDPATGACFDGLQPRGLNLNQGAESAIANVLAQAAAARLDAATDGEAEPATESGTAVQT